jgi:hypothetical protein
MMMITHTIRLGLGRHHIIIISQARVLNKATERRHRASRVHHSAIVAAFVAVAGAPQIA